ncbi:MAG: 4'-phosphopantetheinyl transferase superfamily protein, partial [Gammaproteobacteria bacterium]|nr:4'-phosphopantetheinyl transferase superfamily protein [Gammaproteobacteria bacterium]
IWLCQIDAVQERLGYFSSLLSTEEQARAQRFKFEIHRNRFIISHGFMRSVLARYLNIEPVRILYLYGDRGKPSLISFDCDSLGLKFNMSHTQDITLLAVTRNAELGIDVEFIDQESDWKNIAHQFFTQSEQQSLFSLAKEKQRKAFYQLWTRKEAYMKMLGDGLYLPSTAFSLTVPPQSPGLIRNPLTKDQSSMQVEFINIDLPIVLSNYCATLVAESSSCECHYYQYS